MAEPERQLKSLIVEICTNESWLTVLEIRRKLPSDYNGKLVTGILYSLVKEKVLMYRTDGGDGNSRYALRENAQSPMATHRRIEAIGLPWVRFPKTPEGCESLAQFLEQIEPNEECAESLASLILHLRALGLRLAEAV